MMLLMGCGEEVNSCIAAPMGNSIQRLTELDGIPRNWDFLSYIFSGGERMPVPVALTEAENDGER